MEKHHHKDPILEYHVDIATFMQQLNPKAQGMMDEASAISDKMRQILVDWMVDVHQSFELREETLHLAFMYLEQFQNRNSIKKEQYQLIGITCLWIASKYEEIYPPRMKNYIQITAHTYSAVQLKDMEGKIIQKQSHSSILNQIARHRISVFPKGNEHAKISHVNLYPKWQDNEEIQLKAHPPSRTKTIRQDLHARDISRLNYPHTPELIVLHLLQRNLSPTAAIK